MSSVLIVADAVYLSRNFNLVAEVMATGLSAILAINLVDLATSKGIRVDCDALAGRLGIDVIPVVARSRKSLDRLIEALRNPKLPKSSGGSAGLDDEVLDGCLERLRSG